MPREAGRPAYANESLLTRSSSVLSNVLISELSPASDLVCPGGPNVVAAPDDHDWFVPLLLRRSAKRGSTPSQKRKRKIPTASFSPEPASDFYLSSAKRKPVGARPTRNPGTAALSIRRLPRARPLPVVCWFLRKALIPQPQQTPGSFEARSINPFQNVVS